MAYFAVAPLLHAGSRARVLVLADRRMLRLAYSVSSGPIGRALSLLLEEAEALRLDQPRAFLARCQAQPRGQIYLFLILGLGAPNE